MAGTEFLNTMYINLTRITLLARASRYLTASLRLQLVHFIAVYAVNDFQCDVNYRD
jgi:hypothetical protein